MRQNKIITRFSILLGVLFFWGNSFAQISLSINQQTIKQIIPQIEKTSGYNVFYTDKLPNLDTRKDLLVSNAPLEATLKELFKGTKITFEIKPNKQVLLFQQANKPSGNRKQVPSKLLVEAESFDRKGGWVVDQQFMDLMGSPYLMAHGMGVPVEDASTTISFPESGTYYVYVRTYNWTSPWHDGKGPGKFTLKIGNKKLPIVLGDEGNQWMWQPAGKISVKAGNSNLTLKDLTGFNGRCDAIYFTTEKEYKKNFPKTINEWMKRFENYNIIRLPGLFGDGLKKNEIGYLPQQTLNAIFTACRCQPEDVERIALPDSEEEIEDLVERLMGRKAEARYNFIQENARFAQADLDV